MMSHRLSTVTILIERAGFILRMAAILLLMYVIGRFALIATSSAFLESYSISWMIVGALFFYLMAHAFRALRLGMLVGGWGIGLRTVFSIHFMTTAVGAALPLKIGDIYRIFELSSVAGGVVRSILVVWWERAFDVTMILALLTFAFITTPASAQSTFFAITLVAIAFVLGTAVIFFVAPDNFRRLSLLIIRRHDSRRSIDILKSLSILRQAIQGAPSLVENKLSSLLTLTVFIWVCEVICFGMLLSTGSRTLGAATENLMGFLSAVTLGETLLSVLEDHTRVGFVYLVTTQIPLIILGLLAALTYQTNKARETV